MLELGLKFLLSYFLGSLMGSMIVGRLYGGIDIRTMGSGNAGGTNALRTQGWLFAVGVMIIDIGKGALAASVIPAIVLLPGTPDPGVSREWLQLTCATGAVVGHVWPLWHRYRGGKGAATLLGTLLVLKAPLLVPVLLVWATVLVLSGYVGLATMLAGIMAPLYLAATRLPADQPLFIYCGVMSMYMIYSHRSNIRRMRAGTESRNTQLMVFARNRMRGDNV